MGFKYGLVGLPNSGKSTLFNALVGSGAQVAPYAFTTIDPNIGVVTIEDKRVDAIAKIVRSKKATPTAIEVVDIAGLVRGAHHGEGLGNRFLSHIRTVDAVLHVVRAFESTDVPHPLGRVNAADDASVVDLELMLADLEVVDRRLERVAKAFKAGEPVRLEHSALQKARAALMEGKPVRLVDLTEGEAAAISGLALLTLKQFIYVANVSERDHDAPADSPQFGPLAAYARANAASVTGLSCKIEAELAELSPEEALEFRALMGISGSGAQRLIHLGYKTLRLITFFTANENEARAWTIERGSTAVEAAGKVHTAMAQGFIKAEVTASADLIRVGSFADARANGLTRIEGRDYVVKDGDILLIRFSP